MNIGGKGKERGVESSAASSDRGREIGRDVERSSKGRLLICKFKETEMNKDIEKMSSAEASIGDERDMDGLDGEGSSSGTSVSPLRKRLKEDVQDQHVDNSHEIVCVNEVAISTAVSISAPSREITERIYNNLLEMIEREILIGADIVKAKNEIESTIDADFKSLQTQKLRILIKKKNHLQEMRKAYSPENYEI